MLLRRGVGAEGHAEPDDPGGLRATQENERTRGGAFVPEGPHFGTNGENSIRSNQSQVTVFAFRRLPPLERKLEFVGDPLKVLKLRRGCNKNENVGPKGRLAPWVFSRSTIERSRAGERRGSAARPSAL